jgi:cell division protein FtsI (penicillin-binding protein 3)
MNAVLSASGWFSRFGRPAAPTISGSLRTSQGSGTDADPVSPRTPRGPKAPVRGRVLIAMVAFATVYAIIAGRLVALGVQGDQQSRELAAAQKQLSAARPDLVDRNGIVVALDLKTYSLYAEPRRLVDVDEAQEAVASVFPDLRNEETRKKLASRAGFVWLKREITEDERRRIYRLGIPGIGFLEEKRRFYPGGALAGHIVGHVNIDNQGIAGIEKYLDTATGLKDLHALGMAPEHGLAPTRLSMDVRVQHAVRDELARAKERYRAIAAIGIVLDAHTMEVVAMSSLPDYDPNQPAQALEKDRMNRATAGVFEMGSVFKVFNSGMALDSGKVKFSDTFDARGGLSIGSSRIGDFHGKNRVLSVSEVFIYSSNIGSARMALRVGPQGQYAFHDKLNFHKRLEMEIPETALPLFPRRLSDISTATMSFGHGISVTPMHTAVAAAAMVNGGLMMPPTFLPRSQEEAHKVATRVIAPSTSTNMRRLFALNAINGSGRRADVPGYRVGGKTGTAEKITNGRYDGNKRFNSYLAAFPIDDPQYVVLVVLDEPKPEAGQGAATAGLNAAPTVSNIVRRIGPILGIQPRYDLKDPTVAIVD